jgi:hypothetical protein
MANFLKRNSFKTGQTRNDEQLFETQSEGNSLLTERSKIILKSTPSFSNQTMSTQTFQDARDLGWTFVGNKALQGLIAKSIDIEFTPANNCLWSSSAKKLKPL